VYKKYGITESEFQKDYQFTYKNDKEVQEIISESQTAFERAFMGIIPDLTTQIPAFLTPEKIIEIRQKIADQVYLKMKDCVQGLRQKGVKIFPENPEVQIALQLVPTKEIANNLYIREGLDQFEDAPEKIIQFATMTYAADNAEFTRKMEYIELEQTRMIQDLLKPTLNASIEEILSFLTPENVLSILCQITKSHVLKIQDVLEELRLNDVLISADNPKVLETLQNIKFQEVSDEVYLERGLDRYSDVPGSVFEQAVQAYGVQPEFAAAVFQFEHQKQLCIMNLLNDQSDVLDYINAIGSHIPEVLRGGETTPVANQEKTESSATEEESQETTSAKILHTDLEKIPELNEEETNGRSVEGN